MQFPGKSGKMYPNQMQASSDSAPDQSQPQSITDNPDAMQCIDQLKSMGYTADDVEQAMGGGDDMQPAPSAPSSASVPSMG